MEMVTNKYITDYLLHLADNTLILAQRNAEWCAHGPILEQDIAITNITLDLIGQARNFYQYAAELINSTGEGNDKRLTEDSLAYLRTEREFTNCLMLELPNGDWGRTILRQYFFSVYQYALYNRLITHTDKQIAAIAEKSIKEVTYHVRWSREWVVRLGDGTTESHQRMQEAIDYLWMYTGELFQPEIFEKESGVEMLELLQEWEAAIKDTFEEATLSVPANLKCNTCKGLIREQNGNEHDSRRYNELNITYP
jgi:ring-1,2-phenylacetyl-CoA epoxidase subunit PaaC